MKMMINWCESRKEEESDIDDDKGLYINQNLMPKGCNKCENGEN